jgi:transposase
VGAGEACGEAGPDHASVGSRVARSGHAGNARYRLALRPPGRADGQKKTLIAAEQDRPAIARHRRRWQAHQHRIDPDRLVFVDETWIRTDMTRARGWCLRGTPLLAKVPHGRWRTLTFIAGLRRGEVVAPCVFDGPINGTLFTAWTEQSLVPTLRPRDVVVLDNLGSHKNHRARQAVRKAGAHLLFLPPYSPDLNPIEMLFAKLKTLFRKADRRTVEEAWRELASLLYHCKPDECEAYLRHAGYGAITN